MAPPKQEKKPGSLRKALPIVWELVGPHKWTLLLGLLLVLISQVARLFVPFSTKYLMDTIVLKHHPEELPMLAGAVVVATLINGGAIFSVALLLRRAAEMVVVTTRKKAQNHIAHLPIGYIDSNLTGVLVSRVMADIEGLRNLAGGGMLEFAAALVTATVTIVVLVHKSWQITLLLFVVQVLAGAGLFRAFSSMRPILRKNIKKRAEVTGRLTESIGGLRVIKGYRAESREAKVFAEGVEEMFGNVMKFSVGESSLYLTNVLNTGFTSLFLIVLGGRAMLANHWSVGDYVQYSAMVAFLVNPVFQLVNIGTQFTEAFAGLDRLTEVFAERTEDADPARTIALPVLFGEVLVEDLSFAYEAERPVLHELSFQAQPGTVTALVGPSGSGKSTIISLLSAFHNATTGRILIDGIDLSTVRLESYRTQLGLVLQESFLFDGTLRENVLFSRPGAGEESFLEACRMACVDEFAERFPKGYDTIVGERGVKLSGGQRQRLSIARAILADPRILILDEATSSLDSESEAMIQEGLSYLMQGRTTFVIAHRLSTIRRADQILVLEAGRIVERGTHDSLYGRGGRYYDLYTRQYGLEKNLFLAPFEDSVAVDQTA
jgi:subfamily B ATP-binding cassette protein MsbA